MPPLRPHRHSVYRAMALAAAAVFVAGGCVSNPFKKQEALAPPSLEPPPGVAAPAHTLPQASAFAPPSYADVDGPKLEAALVRTQQESQVMQDEIAALRDQLASTSSQLAQARVAGMPPGAADKPPRTSSDGGVSTTPVVMQSAMTQLKLPELQPRFDGAVVRIDIPADRLFDDGTANLLPEGAAVLTQVSNELERVYPGHFIGIEGHVDTEPLQNASWTSPHQLTAARSAAVFDFLTTRTSMHENQLFLVAHGANHPLVSNATSVGRARNRRVELVVYPDRAAATETAGR
ncbi:MAG: OmpA family protein [Planctomycetia bacterium]|nr:OmpA family protein [Planctomycetia bacterium]